MNIMITLDFDYSIIKSSLDIIKHLSSDIQFIRTASAMSEIQPHTDYSTLLPTSLRDLNSLNRESVSLLLFMGQLQQELLLDQLWVPQE
jgi:hypothetical protein